MSVDRVALDANVLVYAVDTLDVRCTRAQDVTAKAVDSGRALIALQTIGEFYAVVTRKGLQPAELAARQAGKWMATFPVVEAAVDDADAALAVAASGRLSYWDALLMATVKRMGCTVLLSEDMQDGGKYGAVTVRNPFRGNSLPDDIVALLAG